MRIDSLNLPEEVRAQLESLRVEVPEPLAAVFGWISLMPSNKAMLQQSLLATLKANVDPKKKLADRSGGDCGTQDVTRTIIVADATTLKKDKSQRKFEEVQMVFKQSGNRYKPHHWDLTFSSSSSSSSKKTSWTIDDSWGVSVKVEGLNHAIDFAKKVMGASDDSDAAVCVIVLFGLNRNFYDWSTRHLCLFPTDLAFDRDKEVTSWGKLPSWYLACARKWMHLPVPESLCSVS